MDSLKAGSNGLTQPHPPSAQAALLAQLENNADALMDDLLRSLPRLQENGETLADIKGLESEELESLYDLGHDLFQQEQWNDALTVFVYLAAHAPFDIRFQFAAGMCFQQLDNPLAACVALSHALTLDAMRADIAYRLGEALRDAGQAEQARTVLKTTLELINENFDDYHHLREPTEERLQEIDAASEQEAAP